MLERLLIAGSGGQGIVLTGKLLAAAAVKTHRHITFFPCYGAEVRGGTSNCQIILSDEEIASPLVEQHDSLILMNQASAVKFASKLKRRSLLIINSSLCKNVRAAGAVRIPATEIANGLGDVCAANFVMLGAYLSRRTVVPPQEIEMAAEQALAGKSRAILELNIKAFRTGLTL